MSSQIKTKSKPVKRTNESAKQNQKQNETSVPNSESFSQPIVKSPRMQRKTKAKALENIQGSYCDELSQDIRSFQSNKDDLTQNELNLNKEAISQPTTSLNALNAISTSTSKPKGKSTQDKIKEKPSTQTDVVLDSQKPKTKPKKIPTLSIHENEEEEESNNFSKSSPTSSVSTEKKTEEKTEEKNEKKTEKKSGKKEDSSSKFTLEFLGLTMLRLLKSNKRINKKVNNIELHLNLSNSERDPEDRVMYKGICLSELPGTDPNKFARNVARQLFTNKELMTSLLPSDPVFTLGENEDQDGTDEDSDSEIDFEKKKGFLIDRKVKLLVDALKSNQQLSNQKVTICWPQIRTSIHNLGRTLKMDYLKDQKNVKQNSNSTNGNKSNSSEEKETEQEKNEEVKEQEKEVENEEDEIEDNDEEDGVEDGENKNF